MLLVDIDEDDSFSPVRVDAQHIGLLHFVTLRRTVDSSRDVAIFSDINLDLMPDKSAQRRGAGLSGTLTVTDKAGAGRLLDEDARLFAALAPWDKQQTDIAVIPPTVSSTTPASEGSPRGS